MQPVTQTEWEQQRPALEDICMRELTEEVVCVLIVGKHTHAAVEEDDSSRTLGPAEVNKQHFDIDSLCLFLVTIEGKVYCIT